MNAGNSPQVRAAARGRLLSRRYLLTSGAPAAGALALLAACGGSNNNAKKNSTTAPSTAATPGSAAATAAARAASPAAADVVVGGTLLYGASRDVTTLDPHVGTLSEEVFSYAGMFEGSLTYSADSQLVPALAAKYEYPNNTTIIFHYGDGVQFHDGTPFDAT